MLPSTAPSWKPSMSAPHIGSLKANKTLGIPSLPGKLLLGMKGDEFITRLSFPWGETIHWYKVFTITQPQQVPILSPLTSLVSPTWLQHVETWLPQWKAEKNIEGFNSGNFLKCRFSKIQIAQMYLHS